MTKAKESIPGREITTKSSRNTVDAKYADGFGTACTRVDERIDAAFGIGNGAIIRFEPCLDVPEGGVLSALPALLANGLLHGSEALLGQVSGYYHTLHLLIIAGLHVSLPD
ncbi:MAG: hypothetical protein E4H46_05165 [Desulfobacterales bacterium]|nr:MAG: hypothetical protein E4H46_05165 [Desulfobacterales bacterium]